MIFSSKAPSPRATGGLRTALSAVLTCAALLVGALSLGSIGACGGSTSTLDPFKPGRLLVFGDESSSLTLTGRKYGVNGISATTGNIDCSSEPLWVQTLANVYGFAFTECNPGSADPRAFMRAFAGARVIDVSAQVEAQVAAGGFRDKDLATVLAGQNDSLDLYAQYPAARWPAW